jgi:dimethylhistidine N-methyltransferase
MDDFLKEIWAGLTATPKYLPSKYFYDKTGDELFVQIMDCPEYYLTRCELEIFSRQSGDMGVAIQDRLKTFDVVELGAGDCTKSKHLLKALLSQGTDFTYYPIDISENVIANLEERLPNEMPGIKVHGLNGEYFAMLQALGTLSARNKVVLFLGSNIGNIPVEDTPVFLKQLRSYLAPGDLLLTGFDLKKAPAVILAAYNDKGGITRRFNLNLLQRINDTCGADLNLAQFEHLPVYDEQTGACKSYLVSNKEQQACIGPAGSVTFGAGERIHMEISQKYTAAQTDAFAIATGFAPIAYFTDSKGWFLDALWAIL